MEAVTAPADARVRAAPRRDPAAPQPLPRARRRGAGGRGPRVADPRASWARTSRCSSATRRARGDRARRAGLLRGGLRPTRSRDAVRRTGARVVHAHNVNPSFGWRALAAARGPARASCCTCTTTGSSAPSGRASRAARTARAATAATRCPGVRLNCRGGSRAESAAYAPALALWQRRLADTPTRSSSRARSRCGRLRALGAPVGGRARVIGSVQREFAERSRPRSGEYVLVAGRLTAEKGVADAIDACRAAGSRSWSPATGPHAADARARRGRRRALHRPRRRRRSSPTCGARRRAVVPSRYAEILPLAALEAMAAGLPRSRAAPAASPRSCRRRACTARRRRRARRACARCSATPPATRRLRSPRAPAAPGRRAPRSPPLRRRNFHPRP